MFSSVIDSFEFMSFVKANLPEFQLSPRDRVSRRRLKFGLKVNAFNLEELFTQFAQLVHIIALQFGSYPLSNQIFFLEPDPS